MTWVDDVREFHEAMGQPVAERPTALTTERRDLRADLMFEELLETLAALSADDLPAIADGIADLIYVAIGTALECGIPLDAVWVEVHAANMRKTGGPVREDGKILKPDGWTPPDVAKVLADIDDVAAEVAG